MEPAGASGLRAVLALLLAAGWSANHFASLLPVLAQEGGFGAAALEGAFGVYALGLLPGLLGGAALAARLGLAKVALGGVGVAAAANLAMAFAHGTAGIYAGRLAVGLGVGLAISTGSALAARAGGRHGATAAGVVLTSGFAVGPMASGAVGALLPASATLPFVLASAWAGVTLALTAPRVLALEGRTQTGAANAAASTAPSSADPVPPRVRTALAAAVPMALWVFAPATLPMVVLVQQWEDGDLAPWLPGIAAVLTLGTGVIAQMLARRRGWGRRTGVVGALLAAVGFTLAGLSVAGERDLTVPGFVACALLLGAAYGLCLRDGLVDVERFAPAAALPRTIGVFWVCTYLGFGLPVTLEVLRPMSGLSVPLVVLGAVAALSAVHRVARLRALAPAQATDRAAR